MPFSRIAMPLALVAFPLLSLLANSALAQSEIPAPGAWKLNLAKSKLGPEPPPRSITSTIEIVGEHTRVIGVRIDADGIRSEARYTAKLDGKDYPIIGSPIADTVVLRKIDGRTIERIDKKAGKVVESSITVFSDDGKSSTTTGKATNAKGDPFHYTVINEKQP